MRMRVEAPKDLLVLGGGGFVGSQVCKLAVERGHVVTSLSRRGLNPQPDDPLMQKVNWVQGDASDAATVANLCNGRDAVVHAIGALFDSASGLGSLNKIVSGSGSMPDEGDDYDKITYRTASNAISGATKRANSAGYKTKQLLEKKGDLPFLFVSAAEAGWPDVSFGKQVETTAPDWLKRYLKAKRAVEAELRASTCLRTVVFRPSLIWNWKKLDVLPAIPIFNIASALGVPFVDKTVRVETLSRAIVAALEDTSVSGVQRFGEMEALSERL